MTFSYTDPLAVQRELQSTTEFSSGTNPSYDAVVELIREESEQLNSDTGRTWGSTQYTVDVDYNGYDQFILLEHSPIISVDLFRYNQQPLGSTQGEDYVTKTEDTDFTVYANQGRIDFIPGNFSPSPGKKRMEITYTAGYTNVPLRVKRCVTKMVTARILTSLMQQDLNERNDGGSISVGSISIVEPENYGAAKFKQLREDIMADKADLSQEGFGVWRYDV